MYDSMKSIPIAKITCKFPFLCCYDPHVYFCCVKSVAQMAISKIDWKIMPISEKSHQEYLFVAIPEYCDTHTSLLCAYPIGKLIIFKLSFLHF